VADLLCTSAVQLLWLRSQERVNSVVDEVAQLKAQLSKMAQNHSRDGGTAASAAHVGAQLLQQAFVNFTRHIYQLEDETRHRYHGSARAIVISYTNK